MGSERMQETCCYCGKGFEASPIIQTECWSCMRFLPTCEKCLDDIKLDCLECIGE